MKRRSSSFNATFAIPLGDPIIESHDFDDPARAHPEEFRRSRSRSHSQSRPETVVESERDVEKGASVGLPPRSDAFTHHDSDSRTTAAGTDPNQTDAEKNPNIVDWDGPDDPANPLNWSTLRKWAAMYAVGAMCIVSPLASTLIAPAMGEVSRELGITNSTVAALVVSIFVLGYAFGPLVASPLSEIYGRVLVLQIFMAFFFVFLLASAVAKTTAQMIIFRFLAGIGGSAPLTVGAAVLSDVFEPHERGKAMAIFSMGPLIGPIVGPIAGGFMAMNLNWRWPFWLLVIVAGVVLLSSLFILQETYPAIILERKAARLRKETGNQALTTSHAMEYGTQTPGEIFAHNMIRPFVLLFTNPACALISIYMAIVYGYLYLLFVTFGSLFTSNYGQSVGISGLQYLAPGLGNIIGSLFAGFTMDRIYMRLTARNGGVGKPEFRIPLMFIAAFLIPTGLIIYGWTAEKRTHWIWPDIGAMIFSGGVITSFLALNTYVVDAFKYVASAVAATAVLRSVAGATFPLFGHAMFDSALGLGWGNTLLALIALVLGFTYPIFLWKYGPSLRAKEQS